MKSSRFYYGWVVLVMAFLALFASQGLRSSVQAFVRPWQDSFGTDRATVSLVASVSILMYGILGPFVGRLADRYGARAVMSVSVAVLGLGLLASRFATSPLMLLITYSLLGSAGYAGSSAVTATAVVNRWFPRHRSVSMAFIVSGGAAGSLLLSPLSVTLVVSLGWQSTLMAYGVGVVAIAVLIAIFVRTDPSEVMDTRSGADAGTATTDGPVLRTGEVLRRREFWMLAFPFFVCGFTTLGIVLTHLVPIADHNHIPQSFTKWALALSAAMEVVGVLLSGYLSDRWGRIKVLTVLYSVRLVAFGVLVTVGADPAWLVVFAVLFGLTDFATLPPTSALCADLFGRRSVGMVFGWVSLGHQIGAALGAYAAGKFYDLAGTYAPSLLVGMMLLVVGITVVLLTPTHSLGAALRPPGRPSSVTAGQ